MSRLSIEPYTLEHVPAVRAFNQRLMTGGVQWRFPEHPVPEWLPPVPGSTACQEYFLLLDGDAVRGAYMLTRRQFWFGGTARHVAKIMVPLSEGTVNPSYSKVAFHLVRDALRREPLLFSVGLGGDDLPITRLIRALRWRIRPIPFSFRVVHGGRFCRHLRYVRTSRVRALLLDVAAVTGLGWVAAKAAGRLLTRSHPTLDTPDVVDQFGDWTDDLWESCRDHYAVIGTRDRNTLNQIHVASNAHLQRLRISSGGRTLGLAVVEDRQMAGNQYFGDMRVGTIMDVLATPVNAGAVVHQAVRTLEQRGVDVIVSNQSHPAWCAALRESGFVSGPSNFLFATAPALAELIDTTDKDAMHLNRGDGSWPSGVAHRLHE